MIGKVIILNNVETKMILDANSGSFSYRCANIAVVLAAGIADNNTQTFRTIGSTGKTFKIKNKIIGMTKSRNPLYNNESLSPI